MKFFKKLIDISISLLSKKDKSIDKSLRKTEKSLKDIEKKEIITKKIVSKRNLSNVKKFVRNFGNSAIKSEVKEGLPAMALLAQAALETGWGNKILKVTKDSGVKVDSKNLFNIKCSKSWKGVCGYKTVPEYLNKQWVHKKEYFRVYSNYEESFNDYANLILKNSRYEVAVMCITDPNKYIDEIARAGYATDPEYANKIKSIMAKNFEEVPI